MEDFLYICDDAYTREELISMEASILQTLAFDINIPIAYRFLRRYSKVGPSLPLSPVLPVPSQPLCCGVMEGGKLSEPLGRAEASVLRSFSVSERLVQWRHLLVRYQHCISMKRLFCRFNRNAAVFISECSKLYFSSKKET